MLGLLWILNIALAQDPSTTTRASVLEQTAAPYPELAREQGVEGAVRIELDINAEGQVTAARVLQSDDALLTDAAVAAALQLRFSPATDNGVPVASTLVWRTVFSLTSADNRADRVPGTLHASVTDTDDLPVPGARIRVIPIETESTETVELTTSADGRFSVPFLTTGIWIVKVEHDAFEPQALELTLSPGRTLDVDVVLVPLEADEIVVYGVRETWRDVERGAREADPEPVTGVYELTRRDIEATPGSLEDVSRAAHALPGVVSDGDMLAGFHVRGGEQSDVVFLLDRVPLESPFHLGGFNSLFNPDMIRSVKFYSGAAPADVPAGTSAVMAVETWDGTAGDQGEGWDGAIDLSASSARFQMLGALDKDEKWTVALAARRTYMEGYFQVMKWVNVVDTAFAAPEYSELSGRLAWHPNSRHRLMFTALRASDSLALVDSDDESLINFEGAFELDNRMDLLSLDHTLTLPNDLLTWRTTAAYTRDVSYLQRDLAGVSEQEVTFSRAYLRSDVVWSPSEQHTLTVGADASHLDAAFAGQVQDNRGLAPWIQTGLTDLGLEQADVVADRSWFEASAWAQEQYNGPVRVRAGVRTTWSQLTNSLEISPRAGLSVPLPTGTIPKVSVGWYQKPLRDPVPLSEGYGNPDLGMERARHLVVGVDQGFPLPGEESGGLVRVEAYQIDLSDLVVNPDDPAKVTPELNYTNDGSGRNRGVDVMIAARGGRLSGTATYGLLFTERTNPLATAFATTYQPLQDQRHTLGLAGEYQITDRWRTTARYAFHSGRPMSRIVLGADELAEVAGNNTERLGPTHTLDLRAEWQRAYPGRRLTFYVEVLNVGNIKSDFLPIVTVEEGALVNSMLNHLPMRPFLGLRLDF